MHVTQIKKHTERFLPPGLYSIDEACNYPMELNVEDPCRLKSCASPQHRVKLWELLPATGET